MIFSRTSSGLSNMARFYNADLIVFTEGGTNSFSSQEALDGNFNINSVDIKFWSTALKKYGLDNKLHFRALGSKTSAEELALKVANLEIRNVLVARDSDLDDYFNRKIDSPFVLYTYGYSWENDAWHKDSVVAQLEVFNMSIHLPAPCLESIYKFFSDFNRYARRLLLLELIYRKNGLEFITSCTSEQFINSRSRPMLKMNALFRLIQENKEKVIRPAKNDIVFNLQDAVRFCYGKLYECLAYSALCYVSKTYLGIKSIPKAIIIPAMIERFSSLRNDEIDQYYQIMVERLKLSLG